MRYYVIGIVLFAVCVLPGVQPPVEAQIDRDRFVVVEAEELAENPQRYWSRGVVFEDVLEDVTGRSKKSGGRRYIQIETRTLGRCYVLERIEDRVRELDVGKNYLFAGTVISESRRGILFFRPKTEYHVAIDTVELLADDVKGDLLDVFQSGEDGQPAFQNIHKAVAQAQNQLVAFAQNEGVEVEELFNPAAVTMDKAAEMSRIAVRNVERELGVTSMEMLSLLVRELLAAQYIGQEEQAMEPETAEQEDDVEEPQEEGAPAQPEQAPTSDREPDSAQEPEASVEGDEEQSSRRRWFFFGRNDESAEEDDDESAEPEPEPEPKPEALIDEDEEAEAESSGRRWFFFGGGDEEAADAEPEPEAPTDEQEQVEEPASSRRWFFFGGDDDETADEAMDDTAEDADTEDEAVDERLGESAVPMRMR